MASISKDYSVTICVAENIFRIIGSGQFSGQAIQDIFQIVDQHKHSAQRQFIVDLKEANLLANVVEIEDRMNEIQLAQLGADCRLAILYVPRDDLQVTRFKFLESINNSGTEAEKVFKVFTDENEAIVWLGNGVSTSA